MKKLNLPAKLENLETMLTFINEEAVSLGFDSKKLNHIRLAAEEVLVNVINYAYPDKEGNIEIALIHKRGGGLEVEVKDWGLTFNPLSMPAPDIRAPLHERKIGGLGIYLVRKLMDEVSYQRQGERNILTFVKYK
jgi:sigma-B regulation protein RsbU (phosphoserine phosphatase)